MPGFGNGRLSTQSSTMSDTFPLAFTVFTPTYNRAHTLPRVWNSLRQQTFRDFEWLIVDDGSSDNTRELVSSWLQVSDFPIRYLSQRNAHKKTASNVAAREARGRLFLTLDSDDECVPKALERLWWHWMNIPDSKRASFSAVTGLCAYPNGRVVGRRFPCSQWLDSDSIEIFHRWRVYGEKWGFQRTDIMRIFPFPEEVQGYVPEGVVWCRISLQYKTRFVNEVLRIYHQSPDSITRKRQPEDRSAPGNVVWMSSIFENEWPYFRYNRAWFVRLGVNFTRFHLHSRSDPILKAFDFNRSATALILALFPLGCLAYGLDRLTLTRYLRAAIQHIGKRSRTLITT
jgi:glycosyltransferase involved in cell wall biosynthesis